MIIIGNIFGFLNGLFCALSTFQKTKKKLLVMQCVDSTCNIIACILLGGISGAIMALCALLRNILCYKKDLSKKTSLLLAMAIGTIAAIFNNIGWLGILPIVAVIEYTYILGITNNTKIIISALTVNSLMWCVYNVAIANFVGAGGSILILICALFNTFKKKDR